MKITERDTQWLAAHHPHLYYAPRSQKIVGELDFCAAYDTASRKVLIGEGAAASKHFLRDGFEIEMCLDSPDRNGWPKVYEVGGRHHHLAKQCNVNVRDLHFYDNDDSCCLGLKYGGKRHLRLKDFLEQLVIPFFYRLAYVAQFGYPASHEHLWEDTTRTATKASRSTTTNLPISLGANQVETTLALVASAKSTRNVTWKKWHISCVIFAKVDFAEGTLRYSRLPSSQQRFINTGNNNANNDE